MTASTRDSGVIFVFASNKAGQHGTGSALHARLYKGAKYGQGIGRQGNSYAIPTKGWHMEVLPLEEIAVHVRDFVEYAKLHPALMFHVVTIGTGYAGYKHTEMAPLFKDAPANCKLSVEWRRIISTLKVPQDPAVGQGVGDVPAVKQS